MQHTNGNGIEVRDVREECRNEIGQRMRELIAHAEALIESVVEFDDNEGAAENLIDIIAATGRLGGAVQAWRQAE